MAGLAALVPLVVFGFVFVAFGEPARDRFLAAALVWGVLAVAVTEGLGIVSALRPDTVALAWLLIGGALALRRFGVVRGPAPRGDESTVRSDAADDVGTAGPRSRRPSALTLVSLGSITAIAAAVGLTAIAAPPNTWDSMTYHMPRVAHWGRMGSVDFYPTHIPRQLYYPPGAEFLLLQLRLLSGADGWVNLVQWFAFVGCLIAASRIAELLGAGRRGQVIAAVATATLPMAIAQASGTQNDLVVSFWVAGIAYWLLRWRRRPGGLETIGLGLALGMAMLTKLSGYLFAVPLLVWFAAAAWRRRRLAAWKPLLAVAGCAVIVNLGHVTRFHEARRSALEANLDISVAPLVNGTSGAAVLASNAMRNATIHLAGPFERPNDLLERGIRRIHRWVGIGPNDPRTTYPRGAWRVPKAFQHEDVSGNPVHFLLIGAAIALLPAVPRQARRAALPYAAAVAGGALLFCLLLKWQPWHSRLHLPLFVLTAPLVGVTFERFGPRARWTLVVALLASAAPAVLGTRPRRLLGDPGVLTTPRGQQVYSNRPDLREAYTTVADHLVSSRCADAGLVIGGNDWEYPFWTEMRDRLGRWPRLEHVAVGNETRLAGAAGRDAFRPCALIVIDGRYASTLELGGRAYEERLDAAPVRVFRPVEAR